MKNFEIIYSRLKELYEKYNFDINYEIPGLWDNAGNNLLNVGNPFKYFIKKFDEIRQMKSPILNNNIQDELIYNMLPRYTTSYNHRSDKSIINLNDSGSILKTIALLPYIKSLNTTILYLLPITSIGRFNKKGNLGSVYAVKNAYKLDENLNESILEIDLEIQFAALIEAAHCIGIKVICEFIFRTASVDSDLALLHPEWFYWIKLNKINEYAPPIFSQAQLNKIKDKVQNKTFNNTIAPDKEYRDLFTSAPNNVYVKEGQIIGELQNEELVTIPGAFADWPPDDEQPIWSDVTYFKFFNNTKFNYIAYNTVRMYDEDLLNDKNNYQNDLFDYITNIVPYYIDKFNIDGILLDMGHSLPHFLRKLIIEKARNLRPDFIFLEESFIPSKSSLMEGFDAVMGYMIFDMYKKDSLEAYINNTDNLSSIVPPLFSTPENHNTPRLAARNTDIEFSKLTYAVSSFIPKSVRFIHCGFELLNTAPVNTGLDFSTEELEKFSDGDLPLFSRGQLCWEKNICEFIRKINSLRAGLIKGSITDYEIKLLETNNENILALYLESHNNKILLAGNYGNNCNNCKIYFNENHILFINSINNRNFEFQNNVLEIELDKYGFAVGIIN